MDDPRNEKLNDSSPPMLVKGSLDLFDINILPQRFLSRKFTLISIVPWLILVILIATIYPAVQYALEAQAAFQEIKSELILTQANLEINQNNSYALTEIQDQIDSADERKSQILESLGGIRLRGTAWEFTLSQINLITPDDLSLTQISQQDNEIQLEGYANSYQVVIDLNDELNTLNSLQSSEIISLEQIPSTDAETLPANPEIEGELPPAYPTPLYSFIIVTIPDGEVLP